MHTTLILALDDSDPARGWGGPIAIAIAVAIAYGIAQLVDYIRSRWFPAGGPSPTPAAIRDVVDHTVREPVSDTDDTDPDTAPWYGKIITVGGQRFRTLTHIARTGNSPRPAIDKGDDESEVDPEADAEADLADEQETIEEYVDRLDGEGVEYMKIVRGAMHYFDVSAATAKRRIREARKARGEVDEKGEAA